MSRLFLVLATTLLIFAGSLTFILTFDRESKPAQTAAPPESRYHSHRRTTGSEGPTGQARRTSSRSPETSLSLPKSALAHLDQEQIRQVNRILARTQRDARKTLKEYEDRYQLSKNQGREIFPYIVAHHEQAHPDLIVNGQPLPFIAAGSSLEESVSSFLDPSQQDALIEDTVEDRAWWEEVVGQLENDLDHAISNGEMVPADEQNQDLPLSHEAAVGDGGTSEHAGGNLFDLLGR